MATVLIKNGAVAGALAGMLTNRNVAGVSDPAAAEPVLDANAAAAFAALWGMPEGDKSMIGAGVWLIMLVWIKTQMVHLQIYLSVLPDYLEILLDAYQEITLSLPFPPEI